MGKRSGMERRNKKERMKEKTKDGKRGSREIKRCNKEKMNQSCVLAVPANLPYQPINI